jgi:hypothetical protein
MLRRPFALWGASMAFVATAFAAASGLTDTQRRLINALPTVEQVVTAVPTREDPMQTAVAQVQALGHISNMAESIVTPTPQTSDEIQSLGLYRFHAARVQRQDAVLAKLGGRSESGFGPNEQKLRELVESLDTSPEYFYSTRAELFETVLDGELREYAMNWHYQNGGNSVPLRPTAALKRWATRLPPGPRQLVEIVAAVPKAIWIALLVAWVVWGVRYRTTPFGLDPNDPFVLLRGRQKRRMAYHIGRMLSVDVRETERIHTTTKVDEYNRPTGFDHVQKFRSLTQTIRMREDSGREHTITLHNYPFDAHQGQRLLVVYDQKSDKFLFLHNRDTGATRYMPLLESYYRLRPLIMLPVWALAILVATIVSDAWVGFALILTPIVYFTITWQLNKRRRVKLVNELIPRMIDAAMPGVSRH